MAYDKKKYIKKDIKAIMPEGFDKVTIVAGEAEGAEKKTTRETFKAIRSIKRSANINQHFNSKSPALISYNGCVYEMDKSLKDILFKLETEPLNYLTYAFTSVKK